MFSKRQVLAARPEGSARAAADQCKGMMAVFRHGQKAAGRVALAGLLLGLAACDSTEEVTNLGPVEGFGGIVAADEPNAVVVGREVLGNGGRAADAAVAMYFTLAVTYPSRAGLDGGGACVIFDQATKESQALVFLPQVAGSGGVVPIGPRAMAALHARYGKVRWELLVSPAETLARFGHDMSRALAQDFAASGSILLESDEGRRIFAPGDRVAPGQLILQPELAGVLSGIRQQGAGYMHAGAFVQRFAEASAAAGLPVTAEALRAGVPTYVTPVELEIDSLYAWFTPPPAANGLLAADLYSMAAEAGFDDADPGESLHLFIEASAQAFADRAGWLGPGGQSTISADQLLDNPKSLDPNRHRPTTALQPQPTQVVEPSGGTGFVVGDQFGNGVACSLTMNGLFGSQRMAPGTGMVLAAPPPGGLVISPVAVLVASRAGRLYLGAAGGDGAAAATAVARVLLNVLEQDDTLAAAMSTGRVHHNGVPDAAFVEERVPVALQENLLQRGDQVLVLPALGMVNAFYCEGSLTNRGNCEVANDPRGFGLAQTAQ